MASPKFLYGPSFTSLQHRAIERASRGTDGTPNSVLVFENNNNQKDRWTSEWSERSEGSPLEVNTRGLAAFVSTIHDRLGHPTPDVGTLERQRIIERALVEADVHDDPLRYANEYSALFRELEGHGHLTPTGVERELDRSDLEDETLDDVHTIFDRYCQLRDAFAHRFARTRSDKFLAAARADAALTDLFPAIDHVIVSNYIDPSPVEVELLDRIAREFPTTFVIPSLSQRPKSEGDTEFLRTTGTDAALSVTVKAYEDIDFVPEFVPAAEHSTLQDVTSRLYTPAATGDPIEIGDRVHWHEAPTPDREVRHLARRLREQFTTGVGPDEILVFAPGLLSYKDRIEDIFEEYEVPYVTNVSILLERTYAGRAILDVAELCDAPTVATVERLATNPAISLEGVASEELSDLCERLPSNDIGFLLEHGGDPLGRELRDFLQDVESVRQADGVAVLEQFGRVLDRLAIKANAERLDSGLAEGVVGGDAHGIDDDVEATGYEQRAVQRVKGILDSLVPVFERGVDDPLAELDHALQGVRVPAPKQPVEGRVRIVGLEDTPMASYTHLYILGATRDHLGGAGERPRYFQRIHDALGFHDRDHERDLDRYRFGLLLANAESVHITTPAETMAGEEVLPSPMVEELAAVANVSRNSGVSDEPRGSVEDVQRALAGADPAQLEGPFATLQSDGTCPEAQVAAMQRGATMGAARATPGLTEFDGQVGAEVVASVDDDLVRSPFSPTRLNQYAKCGFKYYLNRGLDLTVPEDISLDAARFAVGDVVHEALEGFYADLLDDGDGPVDLDAYSRDELELRLLEAGLQARDEIEDGFDSAFDRHKLVSIFAGLSTPAKNPYYGVETDEAGHLRGTGLLVRALDRELEDTAWLPFRLEAWVGGDDRPILQDDGQRVPVYGKVDRVDIRETGDGTYDANVIDYKTYNTNAKDAVCGLDFQLPAYALGVRSLLEDAFGEPPTAVDAEYRVLQLPDSVKHPYSLEDVVANDLDGDIADFLSEVVPEWIDRLTSGIDAGAFQPAFIGAEDAGCRHCDFAEVCDVRHHRRHEVIEAVDGNGDPAFVPPKSRPGELAEHVTLSRSGGDEE